MIPGRVWRGALVFVAVTACGGGGDAPTGNPGPGPGPGSGPGPGPGPGTTTNAVDVRDNSFDPSQTTVAPGTTVTWTWRGSATHDVTFADGQASPRQSSGTYARTFPAAGTFGYQCSIHSGMSGTVTVN